MKQIQKFILEKKISHTMVQYKGEIKMRDVEEKILKSLEDDIKILKRANTKTNEEKWKV